MRKLIFSAFIIAAATLFACSKEESVEIPTSLSNSSWRSTINPDNFQQTVIEFTDSENAIFSVVERGYGSDQINSQVEYSYTYTSPDITLMPKTFVDPKLTGKAVKLEGAYIYLHLTSNIGDTYNLTQQADKDQTIWQ
ncbi:MAG: hypothetical protein IIU59_04945 [Alistipes sp.]|nr:hypothetical protein [Alistipes sp.]